MDETLTEGDMFALVGYAIALRLKGEQDMPDYFFGLAERIAQVRGDEAGARRTKAVADNHMGRAIATATHAGDLTPSDFVALGPQVASTRGGA